MPTRRNILRGGLGALALGAFGGRLPAQLAQQAATLGRAGGPGSSGPGAPILRLPNAPESVRIGGLPFAPFYIGDDFDDNAIPFHSGGPFELPEPSESVDVVVIGGGISGLSAAWLLNRFDPVVLELRPRFGGNAMGESWAGIPMSMGSAYVITPDKGSYLEWFYAQLGLDAIHAESFPPDPMELGGKIVEDFWNPGGSLPASEQAALAAYSDVVAYMADEGYPDIPVGDDPENIAWVKELDVKTFRADLEEQMGMPLTPLLAAGIQSYFYSSFCAGIDEISAASGWNFVAAEEYGRWVFPGGNASMATALWNKLRQAELGAATPGGGSSRLRTGAMVVDVRLEGSGARITWRDERGRLHGMRARQVVMAGSKRVVRNIMPDLPSIDPERLNAMNSIESGCYLVANVLLDAPVQRPFYDVFLIGDESFPMTPDTLEAQRPVIDLLRADYADPNHGGRSVLSGFWPLPFASARVLLLVEGFEAQAERAAAQVKQLLELVDVPTSAVRQVRLTRWGHGLPIARPNFIASGDAERVRQPFEGVIHFVNQDNWALPAIENSILDAAWAAQNVEAALLARR